ncbi:MAG: hypothetical protein U9R39_06485, partial [Campylobacterota bacterium]|nr:hypothetical protein [Campylobacterota bacterium]
KQAIEKNTKEIEYQNKIMQERNKSLKNIETYFTTRLKFIDKQIDKASDNVSFYTSMASGDETKINNGYVISSEKSIEHLKTLQMEKQLLMNKMSKFIENNPYTIK